MILSDKTAHLLAELQTAIDIRPFDSEGQKKVQDAFEMMPTTDLCYGTTVTYLLQQIHGYHFLGITDYRGYYYSPDNGQSVCPFTIAPRPYDHSLSVVVTSPRGPNAASGIAILEKLVHEIDQTCAFYVKKHPAALSKELADRRRAEVTPWNEGAPYEDDTYSDIIASVAGISEEISLDGDSLQTKQGGPYVKLKQKLRGLEKRLASHKQSIKDFQLQPFNEDVDWDKAKTVITNFFAEKETRGHLSKPVDYFNLFNSQVSWRDPRDVIRAFLTFEGTPLGLIAAERVGKSNCFGVYSLLTNQPPASLFPERVNISELQTFLLIREIAKRGGQFADLGGAETAALQQHHLKYVPERSEKPEMCPVQPAPWLQLG